MPDNNSVPCEVWLFAHTRVRCANPDHDKPGKDPWLRRLYVVWAAVPHADVEAGAGLPAPQPPVFYVSQTNERGYICPTLNDFDPHPAFTLPFSLNARYYVYFVRYPDVSYARKLAEDLNAGYDAAVAQYGPPREVIPDLMVTQSGDAEIEEGVISVEEESKHFLPKGGDLYGGWLLFRGMPGTGSNEPAEGIQCPSIANQIRRLQHHLGRLRYPIGNHYHPYSPEPLELKKHKCDRSGSYPDERIFSGPLWNAVLAFQRDARAGEAFQLDPQISRLPTIDPKSFDPVEANLHPVTEIRESLKFLTSAKTPSERCQADIPESVDTLVETETAAAIQRWLEGDLRKPGQILVTRPEWIDYYAWMREDAFPVIIALNQALCSLGLDWPVGLETNNSHRDARMSVVNPGPGQIIYSIHKSGMAFDMAMGSNYYDPRPGRELFYAKDESASDDVKTRWTVWAPVPKNKIPAGDLPEYAEYVDTIDRWMFDSKSVHGGKKVTVDAGVDRRFLNFTKVCDHFGLKRIGAHGGWRAVDLNYSKTINSYESFEDFVVYLNRLVRHQKEVRDPLLISGQGHALGELANTAKLLYHWLEATRPLKPNPTVTIQPWTKEGEAAIRRLRSQPLAGLEIEIVTTVKGYGFETETLAPRRLTLSPKMKLDRMFEFTATPLTKPVRIRSGSTVEMKTALLPGSAPNMEWWHFQWEDGFRGKTWLQILQSIGWTEEGLLDAAEGMTRFGLGGLGYRKARKVDGVYMAGIDSPAS